MSQALVIAELSAVLPFYQGVLRAKQNRTREEVRYAVQSLKLLQDRETRQLLCETLDAHIERALALRTALNADFSLPTDAPLPPRRVYVTDFEYNGNLLWFEGDLAKLAEAYTKRNRQFDPACGKWFEEHAVKQPGKKKRR